MPSFDLWRAGEIIVPAKLNAMIPSFIELENDFTKTNSTLSNVTDISFTPDINATYYYELYISYGAIQAADIRWAWSASQATFNRYVCHQLPASSDGVEVGNNIVLRHPAQGSSAIAGGGNDADNDPDNFMSAWDRGTFTTTGTAAAITLQFAQGTTNATASVLRGGNNTRLVYTRIA